MLEIIESQSLETTEVDIVIHEMETFNSIVDEIDAIPFETKEELVVAPGGKFGQKMDFENGFGQER